MNRFVISFAIALSARLALAADAPKPNIVIVLTDDQGLGDFSFTGNPLLKTPHLDAFARESVRLADFHVAPMCTPTRGQLLTGLAALRNGATSVTAGRTFLRPGIPTLAQIFNHRGYKTGLFGKWHLGDSYPHRPIDKGFHESIYHLGWGQLHSTPEFDWPLVDGRYFQNGVEKHYRGHCTDFWFDSAMAWMKQRSEHNEPFLCYLATNAPHAPHIDLDEYIAPYQSQGPAGFFGMIAHIDRRFGDLEKFLTDEELRDNTIVVFMTDNGGTAGVATFNAGLRAGKTTYYDGGHRVPCWIRWPGGSLGPPRDIHTPTQITDLLPTLCELAGAAPPEWSASDEPYRGSSLAGLLRGTHDLPADRKLVVQYGQIPKKFDACVIEGKWRLVKGTELYDIDSDRAQASNVADVHPAVVQELRDYYEKWWSGLEPTLDDFVPISIGARQQPVVELNSGDWEGIYADNTGFVREAVGGPTGGHWHIQVEQPGEYEFQLRRWPVQTGAALGAKYEPSAKSPPNKPKVTTAGFPAIASAHVEIAGVSQSVKADPASQVAVLRMTLPAGRTRLKAWFRDAAGTDLCGAFFVTVTTNPPLLSPSACSDTPKRPNILLIYTDDQSYKTVGCYPESWPWVKTPQIDSLARSGIRFHGAYLGGWCMPSRASILTGRQPHGIQSMRMEGEYPGSTYDPEQCPFFPALFRRHGYHTAQIGKWHTGVDAGFGRDWDYQIVWNRPKHPDNAGAYYEKQLLAFNGAEKWQDGYPADNYTQWAVDYIRGENRAADKPWFLWLCYGSVHGPSKPADRHKGRYRSATVPEPADLVGPWPGKPNYLMNTLAWRRAADGGVVARSSGEKVGDEAGGRGTGYADWVRQLNECVPAIDEAVGKIIDQLKKTGQLENTLLIYTADQGLAMGEHGLRMKIAPYDASYRSPLIVSMPGTIPAGHTSKVTPTAPDLISTIFTFAAIPPLDSLHGRDLTTILKDPAAAWPHPALYEHTGHDYGDDVTRILRDRPADAIYQKVPWYTAVVQDGWKYIRYLQPGVPEELYDLGSDPEELKNLADAHAHATRLAQMRQSLADELKRTDAPKEMIPTTR